MRHLVQWEFVVWGRLIPEQIPAPSPAGPLTVLILPSCILHLRQSSKLLYLPVCSHVRAAFYVTEKFKTSLVYLGEISQLAAQGFSNLSYLDQVISM